MCPDGAKDKKEAGDMYFGSLLFRVLAVLGLPMPRVLPSLEYNRVSKSVELPLMCEAAA